EEQPVGVCGTVLVETVVLELGEGNSDFFLYPIEVGKGANCDPHDVDSYFVHLAETHVRIAQPRQLLSGDVLGITCGCFVFAGATLGRSHIISDAEPTAFGGNLEVWAV